LSSDGISRDNVPIKFRKKIPHNYSVPVILLGRLAVDKIHKNKGYVAFMLVDALKRSFQISEKSIGAMAIIVDPINDVALSFYEKYGFLKLVDSGKMFLPMKVIKDII
jgi:predicted acetyltransferase